MRRYSARKSRIEACHDWGSSFREEMWTHGEYISFNFLHRWDIVLKKQACIYRTCVPAVDRHGKIIGRDILGSRNKL